MDVPGSDSNNRNRPILKKYIRRNGRFLLDGEGPFAVTDEETQDHFLVLRYFGNETVIRKYQAEPDPDRKRALISFLKAVGEKAEKGKESPLEMFRKADIPRILDWIQEFPAKDWDRLALALPANPNILGKERNFRNWARSVLKIRPY